MPAFVSAWDSHRTSDSAGRDSEYQGLSLTRFEIIVGLKRKICILSLPHFPLAPIQHCLGMSNLHVIFSAALNWERGDCDTGADYLVALGNFLC